jgi:two-component system invasion response regulator UvrY
MKPNDHKVPKTELLILIADDHSIVRKGMRQLLLEEFSDALIDEVPDAESMIKSVMDKKYDIIISDLSMPGRSGLDAIPQIRQFDKQVPIIIMSIHPEEHYAVRVLKAGASAYICKDMATEELINAVKIVLTGRKYITSTVAEKLVLATGKNDSRPPHDYLSDREFAVMKLLAVGKSISDIANSMNLGLTTISTYRTRVLHKLDMKSNAELTVYCLEKKLI